jgi:hypothetical protein
MHLRDNDTGAGHMLTANDFRRIALGMEGAIEGAHMGHPDFRVNNRIFATLHDGDRFGMVALSPEDQAMFIRSRPSAFEPESGAWGLQGCTRVHIDSVDEDALGEAMTLAWRRAVAKPATKRARATSAATRKIAPKPRTAAAGARTRASATSTRTRTFSQLVSPYPNDVQDLAKATRALMLELLPKVSESVDPTGPYITYAYARGYAGVVSYITVNQKGVKLGVAGGASLSDPEKLLQGSGKSNRHVVIKTTADLKRRGLRQLVRAALAAWKKEHA